MNNNMKNVLIWIAVIVFLLFVVGLSGDNSGFNTKQQTAQKLAFSDFLDNVNAGLISEINIQGANINGTKTSGENFQTYMTYDPDMIKNLRERNVKINVLPPATAEGSFWSGLLSWLPMLFFIGIWIFLLRQMTSSNGKAMGFGKSKARLISGTQDKVTFTDVAGIDEAKQELEEIVDYLKDPSKFRRLGGKIPKGVLLVGSPGTGKTLLARAVAGEAGVPFFSISGSDFVEMFVGVGASRVRDMFEQGKKNSPCIIFIDEIDAVGRHRGAGLGGGNDEREQTLNQLLVEMDGFDANSGVILVAATNRPDVLDPALLRPGRFDRQIVVPIPDIVGREQILNVHVKKVPLAPDVKVAVVARGTPGFSGADLANIVNEAALIAARRNKRKVTMEDFEYAKDKIMMGSERKSMLIHDDEKKMTAYHEAGHAICSLQEPTSDPIHKATIIPRGRALGMVVRLPERDPISISRAKLMSNMVVAFGGRIAEEEFFGYDKVSTGASSDISMATKTARNMVTQWGMSDLMGPVAYEEPEGEVFLGHAVTKRKNISEATAQNIDKEIRNLMDTAYARAKEIITAHKSDLVKLAEGLIQYETLSGDEIKELLAGKKIERPELEDISPVKSSVPEIEE